MRSHEDKRNIIEFLSDSPHIRLSCKKAGVSSATFYRWIQKDKKFKKEVGVALKTGRGLIVEVAEMMLIKKVQDKDLGAIKFALQQNSKRYQPTKPKEPPYDGREYNSKLSLLDLAKELDEEEKRK